MGNIQTGKSTLRMKISNSLNKDLEYQPSIGATFCAFRIKNEYGNFKFEFWDTAGMDKFFALNKIFYKDADAIFILYNSYDISSFEKVKRILDDVKYNIDKMNCMIVLIRCRYDEFLKNNESKNIVSDEEVLEFAELNNLYFTHLSNFEKYGGFDELIKTVCRNFVK